MGDRTTSISLVLTSVAYSLLVAIRVEAFIAPSPSFNSQKFPARHLTTIMASEMLLESSLDACTICCKSDDFPATQQYYPFATFIRTNDLVLKDGGAAYKQGTNCVLSSVESPEAGRIMSALVVIALKEATDETTRWSPTSATDKILRKRAKSGEGMAPIGGSWTNAAFDRNEVLVWSSKCTRYNGYGSDNPIIKARGLINASAATVVELIGNSDRVREYNKLSIGREDDLVLTATPAHTNFLIDNIIKEDEGSIPTVHSLEVLCPRLGVPGLAKVMSSKSQPPLTLKPLEFKTLYYARRLDAKADGVELDEYGAPAYVTVGRSTWETPTGTTEGSDKSCMRCEILLAVNLVRGITTTNGEELCELTLITHAISPGIPIFIGRPLALTSAENYIKDIRALFEQ